jgi:malonyl-CoA O-methyltransferase
MSEIDKNFVKRAFNTSAKTYDQHTSLQKSTITELLDHINPEDFSISRALDIGTGTGNLTAGLIQRFPKAKIYGCDLAGSMLVEARRKTGGKGIFSTADAELLPYKENSFELVVSSFTFQWLNDWSRAINEIKKVLKPGGTFAFSVFGAKTFFELRQSFIKACAETGYSAGEPLKLSTSKNSIMESLVSAGFVTPVIRSYSVVEEYDSVRALIKSIRGMGAKNASNKRNRTPGVRTTLMKMFNIYEKNFGKNNKIAASFEIIAGRAQII